MGQYHKVFNLDKKEYIHGHRIGTGLKLMEQVGFDKCAASAVWLLLAASNGRGGGDAKDHGLIGRWAGDRIAVIGDYSEPDDIPGVDAPAIYGNEVDYVDISANVKGLLEHEFGTGDPKSEATLRPDMVLNFRG
jgi:hypothetical protein